MAHPVHAVRMLESVLLPKNLIPLKPPNQKPLKNLTIMVPVVFNHVPTYVENGLDQIPPKSNDNIQKKTITIVQSQFWTNKLP